MAKWWQDFHKSISDGNNKKIMFMLKKVSVLKTFDRRGNGLLHHVAKGKIDNEALAAHLIAAGCDVNVKNHQGDPPLTNAIICKNVKIAKQLLDAGALHSNVEYKNDFGALHIATYTRCCEMVKILLKAGANVKATDGDGYTPLHVAIISYSKVQRQNNNKLVRMLIEAGSDVNAEPKEGYTPFIYAIMCGLNDVVEPMLKAGADVNAVGQYGMTPLILAVLKDNVVLAKELVKAGANVNWADVHNRTCLHYAASSLNVDMVKLLLENGASVNVIDKDDISPLLCCSYCCNAFLSDVEMRMANSKECDEIIEETFPGQTGIKADCMRLLLEYGANLNFVSEAFTTPIVYTALILSHSEIVRLLLNFGAVVDYNHDYINVVIRTCNKTNALHELIKHTAKCHAQNKKDGPSNFNFDKLKKKQQEDYERCRSELDAMKTTWIHGSVNVFKLFLDKDIGPYARNEQLTKAYFSKSIETKFPIYGRCIHERFSKELKNQNIVKAAAKGLSRIVNWDSNSLWLVLDHILSYLDQADLKNLTLV